MGRWFQQVRIADYPTRYEQECQAWNTRDCIDGIAVDDDGLEFRVRYYYGWNHLAVYPKNIMPELA